MKSPLEMLSDEARLVLHADSPRAARDPAALAPEGDLDWDTLLELADRERAFLPLWRTIRDLEWAQGGDGVPLLKQAAGIWEFKLLHLERLLLKLLDVAAERNIDVLLLKGAAVTLHVYGEFGRRPMFDVDLLVRPEDARELWDVARDGDWTWDEERFPQDSYESAHHLPTLFDAFGSGTGLEIHSNIWLEDHPFAFDSGDVWRESALIEVQGRRVRIPSVEHQLLHCCIHFAWSHCMVTHGWRAFRDTAAFVDSNLVDWDAFVDLARSSRGGTCVYWTLRLARTVNDVDVPKRVLEQLSPGLPRFVLDRLERHYVLNLLAVGEDRYCPSLAVEQRLWRLGIGLGPPSEGIHLPEAPDRRTIRDRLGNQSRRLRDWGAYLWRLV